MNELVSPAPIKLLLGSGPRLNEQDRVTYEVVE
jgi:hypothetical protein